MSKQRGLWDFDEHLGAISAKGIRLRRWRRRWISSGSGRFLRRRRDGLAALDTVLKFKMLVLQSLRGLSLDATETMVRDRMAWLRFCGLELNETVPDANTLRDFREALIKAGALDDLFREMTRIINEAGFISRSGRIADASLVAAPRQRATE